MVCGLTVLRKAGAGLRFTVEKNTKAENVEAPIPTVIIRNN